MLKQRRSAESLRKYLFFGGLRAKRELAEDPPARGRSPWRKSRARSSRWRPVASSLAATGQRTSSHQATSLPAFASTYAAPPCPPRAPARAHRTNARAQVAVRSGATKPRGGVYPKTSLFVGQVSSYCTSPDDPGRRCPAWTCRAIMRTKLICTIGSSALGTAGIWLACCSRIHHCDSIGGHPTTWQRWKRTR